MPDFLFLATMLLSKLFVPLPLSNDSFLFMSGSTWAQLFSGVIGATLGAVAAAWVASRVLSKTLAAQQEISAEALALQRSLSAAASAMQTELAERQLREQRAGLERQLSEQREALSRQLGEQREEASKARSYAAIADLVAALDALINHRGQRSNEDVEKSFLDVRSAMIRWELDLDSDDLVEELRSWPELVWFLAKDLQLEEGRKKAGLPDVDDLPFDRLTDGCSLLSAVVRSWPKISPEAQNLLIESLREKRTALTAEGDRYRESRFADLAAQSSPA